MDKYKDDPEFKMLCHTISLKQVEMNALLEILKTNYPLDNDRHYCLFGHKPPRVGTTHLVENE